MSQRIDGREDTNVEQRQKQIEEDLEANRKTVTLNDAWPVYIKDRMNRKEPWSLEPQTLGRPYPDFSCWWREKGTRKRENKTRRAGIFDGLQAF